MSRRLSKCPCGSGEWPEMAHDGHGIFLFYCCSKCEDEKFSHYRPDIRERYEADEPIDPDADIPQSIRAREREADHVDGFDRDDLGESPDF